MNHIGVLVKLLIKFAKKLPDFLTLPQAAQVTLLKGGRFLHLIITTPLNNCHYRSRMTYNSDNLKSHIGNGTAVV